MYIIKNMRMYNDCLYVLCLYCLHENTLPLQVVGTDQRRPHFRKVVYLRNYSFHLTRFLL